MPCGTCKRRVLCGKGEICSEDQTEVLTRVIPGKFSLTPPALLKHCAHIPCPQGDHGVQGAVPNYPGHTLIFTDNLKTYAENQEVLGDTLKVVDRVSHAVGMELGLQKCAVAHI